MAMVLERAEERRSVLLTIKTMMMMSQPPLMKYIFHPIFSSPMGMVKTKINLVMDVCQPSILFSP
jgi:hypothetical protein